MANIYHTIRIKSVCLYCILITFSLTTIPQLHASPAYQAQVGLNDAAQPIFLSKNELPKEVNKYISELFYEKTTD